MQSSRKSNQLAILAAIGVASTAQAQFTMLLEGDADSTIVSVTLSGSDTVTSESFGFAIGGGFFFDITDGSDPFSSPIGLFDTFTFEGAATFQNVTTNTVLDVIGIGTQNKDSQQAPDRFGVTSELGLNYTLSTGDVFAWEGSGTFDLAELGLDFGDLKVGSFQGSVILPGIGNTGLDATLVVIPAPASMALLGTGILVLARRRR